MSSGDLDHVRWIGGATGAGKTTVAMWLGRVLGLDVYSTDAAIAAHSRDLGPDAPLLSAFRAMTMDERWLRRDPLFMLESFPWFTGERFGCIVDDLRAPHPQAVTIAEGFRLLPRLVRPLIQETWQALWLVSTPAFRRQAFARRAEADQFWRRTSDPPLALERLLERDALFADRMSHEASELGLKVIVVDGAAAEGDIVGEAARWLRLGDQAT